MFTCNSVSSSKNDYFLYNITCIETYRISSSYKSKNKNSVHGFTLTTQYRTCVKIKMTYK